MWSASKWADEAKSDSLGTLEARVGRANELELVSRVTIKRTEYSVSKESPLKIIKSVEEQ